MEQTALPSLGFGEVNLWPKLKVELEGWIIDRISKGQPGPHELLAQAEAKFGWPIRAIIIEVLDVTRESGKVQSYLSDYIRTTLSDEAMRYALRGGVKEEKEYQSTLDELFRRSAEYRRSEQFREAVEFTARFRDYAPYNNLLVKIQRPSCCFYATQKDWWRRFERTIKEDARPMLILAPMHPVMLVYDLDDTEGKELPEKFQEFIKVEGEWNETGLHRLLENAVRDKIEIRFKPLGSLHGGFAARCEPADKSKMRVVVHEGLNAASSFSVLCHELAHIYLGHLGSDQDGWWPCRTNLDHRTVEIEAEAASFIVCSRVGLSTSAAAYLASFMKEDVPDRVSIELIVKVAGKLEEMSSRLLPARKVRSGKSATDLFSNR